MRAIQTYKKIFNSNIEFADLLTWKLSILQNKQLNLTTVFYGDIKDKEYLSNVGIIELYDEVNWLTVEDSIDFTRFWAFMKIFAIRAELSKNLDEEFFMQDTDLVIKDNKEVLNLLMTKPVVAWAPEYNLSIYPTINEIVFLSDFTLPTYFDAEFKPINCAIIKAPDFILSEWINICLSSITANFMLPTKIYARSKSADMITIEQLYLPNIIGHYKLPIQFITFEATPNTAQTFHLWGLKSLFLNAQDSQYKYSVLKALFLNLKLLNNKIFDYYMETDLDDLDLKYLKLNWDAIVPIDL